MREIVTCALAAAAMVGCSSEPELGAWTVPVPKGTPTSELAEIPLEQRDQRLELVQDLTIGGDGDDPEYLFGWTAPRVAVDATGRIYAIDSRGYRIQVFSRDGDFLRTIGRRGQGPGEFSGGAFVTVAGDTVALSRRLQPTLVWTLDGEYLYNLADDATVRRSSGTGLDDGTYVARWSVRAMDGVTTIVARRDARGEDMRRYVELPAAVPLATAVDPSGILYISTIEGHTQQITAFAAAGEIRWAVRILRGEPSPVPLALGPGGELYAFFRCGPEYSGYCFDVFTPSGERRLAGRVDDVDLDTRWQVADGSYVYGADRSAWNLEWKIVRFRIQTSASPARSAAEDRAGGG